MHRSSRLALVVLFTAFIGSASAQAPGGKPPRAAAPLRQLDNTELGYRAPVITEFVILPMDFKDIEETKGLVEVLNRGGLRT